MLAAALPDVLRGLDREQFTERRTDLEAGGVPAELAHRVASMQSLLSVFDIVVDAGLTGSEQPAVTDAYFAIGSRLGLDWLRDRILELPRTDRWQSLARAALRDDLYRLHRSLTREILLSAAEFDAQEPLDDWLERNATAVERADAVLADVKASRDVRHHHAAGGAARAAQPRRRRRSAQLSAPERRGASRLGRLRWGVTRGTGERQRRALEGEHGRGCATSGFLNATERAVGV